MAKVSLNITRKTQSSDISSAGAGANSVTMSSKGFPQLLRSKFYDALQKSTRRRS